MKNLIFLLILFLLSCSKDNSNECTISYYENYSSYWEWCRYASSSLDTAVYNKYDQVSFTICPQDKKVSYKKLGTSCPRSGSVFYNIKTIIND